jgi:hypothetical protein
MPAFVPCLPSTVPRQSTDRPYRDLRLTFVVTISAAHKGQTEKRNRIPENPNGQQQEGGPNALRVPEEGTGYRCRSLAYAFGVTSFVPRTSGEIGLGRI